VPAVGGDNTKQDPGGDAVDLVGTPVDPSRRMRGISQEEYLARSAGHTTEREMRLAGLERHRQRRTALVVCLTLALVLAALLLWRLT
jgi:hypothetical protein